VGGIHHTVRQLSFHQCAQYYQPGIINALGGMALFSRLIAESAVGWRGLYWGTIPLMLSAGGLLLVRSPENTHTIKPKMDVFFDWRCLIPSFDYCQLCTSKEPSSWPESRQTSRL
jgi:hypothetical protein